MIAARAFRPQAFAGLVGLAVTETDVERRGCIATALRVITQSMNEDVRRRACDKHFETIRSLLTHPNWRMRCTGVDVFRDLQQTRAVPHLIHLLRDPFVWQWRKEGQLQKEPTITIATVGALAQIGDPRAVKPLAELLERPIESQGIVRKIVLEALDKIGDPQAIPEIEQRLSVLSRSQRQKADRVLQSLRGKARRAKRGPADVDEP